MVKIPPEIKRARSLKYNYNLTPEDYAKMVLQQHGMCAICKRKPTGLRRDTLYVDHDHITNKVRGLLCRNCNFGLGQFNDDAAVLSRATSYILAS